MQWLRFGGAELQASTRGWSGAFGLEDTGEDTVVSVPPAAIPVGAVPVGAIPGGEIPEGKIRDGTIPEGEIPEGKIPDGEIPEREIPDGEIPVGSIPEGELMVDVAVESSGTSVLVVLDICTAPPYLIQNECAFDVAVSQRGCGLTHSL